MKVLISGYYGFYNVGDEAILKSMIIALKKEDPCIEIIVLSNDVKYTEITCGVKAINRWNLANIYKELIKSDGLISGGGSLLQDATSSRTVMYYSSIIALAKLAKKPVFIYAQGIGPLNKKFNTKIVKKALNKADYITLRDEYSKQLIRNIGVKQPIDIVPDPVMGLHFDKNNTSMNIVNKASEYITISIRKWKKTEPTFLKNIAAVCDNIMDKGIDIVFIPMHGEVDEKISKQVVELMNNNPTVLSHKSTIEEKVSYIENSKLMIGMRLHALIFAANVSTPMIGISYDPKIDSYLSLVNQPSVGNVDELLDVEYLSNLALAKVKNYENEKIKLQENTYKLKESAFKTASMAISVLKKEDKKNNRY